MKAILAIHDWMEKHSVAPRTREEVLVVEAHNDAWPGELAVGEKMEEACLYSQVFHAQLRMSSDVSSGLVQTSVALPAHSFWSDYNMEGLMVFVDDRNTQELQEEDARRKGIVVDSMSAGKEYVHKEM